MMEQDYLVWQDSDGREWRCNRTSYPYRCDWSLLDPDGRVVDAGMSTTGKNQAAVKQNATRQARRVFKVTSDA